MRRSPAPTGCARSWATTDRHQPRRGATRAAALEADPLQAGPWLILTARGYAVAAPEALTFDDQVMLFSRARIVVGGAGAAINDLPFCRPDGAVITLVPQTADTGYGHWRNMAATVAEAEAVSSSLGPGS